jgi:thermostable 8-oxoguanine DNA glycosylase
MNKRLKKHIYKQFMQGYSIEDLSTMHNAQEYVVENILREVADGNKQG